MADTGAPWNLPYPLPTDLVRDGADAIKDLAEATADGLDAAGNPGIGSNVVQTVKTDVFTTTSSTFTTITGLSATITPSSATSKVLIIAQVAVGKQNTSAVGHFRLAGGNTSGYVGNADGSRVRAVFGGFNAPANGANLDAMSIVFVDSPTSASAVTYSVECRRGASGTIFVNRGATDDDNDNITRGASSITVIEVSA